MEETDIIICLKKRNKDLNNTKKIIVRLENIFHKCRYNDKNAFQNCYHENIFCLFFH